MATVTSLMSQGADDCRISGTMNTTQKSRMSRIARMATRPCGPHGEEEKKIAPWPIDLEVSILWGPQAVYIFRIKLHRVDGNPNVIRDFR